ncbi:MAG: phage integrase SAM-like domain-containing protein [Aureisphaera sp.]
MLFRYNDKDYVFGARTKFEVSKHYFTKEHTQKRPKDIEVTNKQLKVNTELNNIENHVLGAFRGTDLKSISKDWLKLQIELYYNPPQQLAEIPITLIEYIDFYIDYRKHEIKPTSIVKYNVIKHKLERMQIKRKSPIFIKKINDNFKNEFVAYQKSKGYAQNTIQRELTFIKTFCKHARYLGLETDPQLDSLKLEKVKAEKIYLSFKELEAIEKAKLEYDYLENARDWLIISCYTGQRISDFLRFTKDMIRLENGKSLLEFTQKKTNKVMTVPLHNKVLHILDKRNGNFPRSISDQRYNDYIKVVCEKAKLNEKVQGGKQLRTDNGIRKVSGKYPKWELVTSHIGRRSFATNFYGTIPTSYLIYITGHSSEAMFLNYIGKSNKDLAMEISNYF